MKYYLAALFGIFVAFGALVPSTAEARSGRDWHRSLYSNGHGHAYGHRKHWKKHHHKKYSRKVYRPGHHIYRYGHRVWVPGRFVIIVP
jgi:hypothetical protein